MILGKEAHCYSSPCFKSISVGTGSLGAGKGFNSGDRHIDENMLGIPEYDISSLPTITGTNKNTLGCNLAIGSATLLLKNHKDGRWYRFNGTVI